jgi:thiol-disulfide isomerase/thioredoxin
LFEDFNIESKQYFKKLIKYEYLNILSTFILKQSIKDFSTLASSDVLPFSQHINTDFLEWKTFENSFNDTCHYELEVFQNYVFNTLLLFSIEQYNYQLQTIDDFQMFTVHFFNFMSNNVSSIFFPHCVTTYTKHFTPLFQRQTMNYILDFLHQKNFNKDYITSINTIFESNYNPDQETIILDHEALRHEFYMEDVNGKQIALNAFEGKVLYVDIWASWCGPCRKQFPYSQELKKKLSKKQLKKIKFVYISIDNDYTKWKESIKKLNIEGYNFISPADKSNNAGRYFGASSIPRYILIDQDGNIVDKNAKRPSDPTLLDDLLQLIN